MKKLMPLLAVLLLCACGKTPPEPEPSATPSPVPIPLTIADTEYHSTLAVSDALRLEVTARYPLTNVAAIDAYYDDQLRQFVSSAELIARESGGDAPLGVADVYSTEDDYEIVLNDGVYLSVHRTVTDYLGGAHPGHTDKCDTFLAADGRRISLDDLFAVPRDEYTPRLTAYFDTYIDRDRDRFYDGAKQNIRLVFPYDAFCVTGTADAYLRFYFSPYTVAPYAAGTIVIPVPLSEITDLLVAAVQ